MSDKQKSPPVEAEPDVCIKPAATVSFTLTESEDEVADRQHKVKQLRNLNRSREQKREIKKKLDEASKKASGVCEDEIDLRAEAEYIEELLRESEKK